MTQLIYFKKIVSPFAVACVTFLSIRYWYFKIHDIFTSFLWPFLSKP